jgi:hypothetical protein
MLGLLRDVAPRALLAGAALWGGANYLFVGPGIGARIVNVDHLPVCERNHEAMILAAAKDRAADLPSPSGDPVKEMATDLLRQTMDSPLMKSMEVMSGELNGIFPIGKLTDIAIAKEEQAAKAAKEAYDRSVERLKRETATSLANSGTVCGCVADAAIEATRTEWAIWTGTLTLVRPAPIQNFDQRMGEAHASGRCNGVRTSDSAGTVSP